MIHNYSGSAEQWVWDIRCEPGVVGAFAKLFGTEDLISSFDAFSIMLPGRKDIKDIGKWEHTDQSPSRVGELACFPPFAFAELTSFVA